MKRNYIFCQSVLVFRVSSSVFWGTWPSWSPWCDPKCSYCSDTTCWEGQSGQIVVVCIIHSLLLLLHSCPSVEDQQVLMRIAFLFWGGGLQMCSLKHLKSIHMTTIHRGVFFKTTINNNRYIQLYKAQTYPSSSPQLVYHFWKRSISSITLFVTSIIIW